MTSLPQQLRRNAIVVDGPLAAGMRRFALARESACGSEVLSLPALAARLAGGFIRPASGEELEEAVAAALGDGNLPELEPVSGLPGLGRAVLGTLRKVWRADIDLAARSGDHARIAAFALIEARVRNALPSGALLPRDLRDRALLGVASAPKLFETVTLEQPWRVAPLWSPLIEALEARIVVDRKAQPDLRPANGVPAYACTDPHHEVVEALRWARRLLASGAVAASGVAIATTLTEPYDDHVLTLARDAELPIHFSHGVPALSTWSGQACAALADVLLNGLTQDRVRRVLRAARDSEALRALPEDWGRGLPRTATLRSPEQWGRALSRLAPERAGIASVLLPVLELLARGPTAAAEAGATLLPRGAHELWRAALRAGPPHALELTLGDLRVPDGRDPAVSVVWCPSDHLAGAPRAHVRLIGLASGGWPRARHDDPLLPDHILPARLLVPDPVEVQDVRAFDQIVAGASDSLVLTRSLRNSAGGLLAASPLLRLAEPETRLGRTRIPEHAFSESDRLLARPREARESPLGGSAVACWANRRRPDLTAHDGLAGPDHPLILEAIERVQSATSLSRLLRDPLGYVWRYGLGWRAPELDPEPLSLDARAFGELVHELLRTAVRRLEPAPGLVRAHPHEIEEAVRGSADEVLKRWPLQRSVPPPILWRRTVDDAAGLAVRGLLLDETFRSSTRSWTEVPFGLAKPASPDEAQPWDPCATVGLTASGLRIGGSIDRLDLRQEGDAARVTDYKTGEVPPKPVTIAGGGELQRVLYSLAVRRLLPEVEQVVTRLAWLKGERPRSDRLHDPDAMIERVDAFLAEACALLRRGVLVPGPAVGERFNAMALAHPADLESYMRLKRPEIRRLADALTRAWDHP